MACKRLRAYVDGALRYDTTDTAAISGGSAGFTSANSNDVVDDFECGNMVAGARSAVFSDNFNRADENLPADADWSVTRGTWAVVSNEAKATVDRSNGLYTEASGALDDNNTYAKLKVTAWGASTSQPFLCLNVIDTIAGSFFDEQYFWGWDRQSSRWLLGRVTGGSQTNFVAEAGAGAPTLPYTLELEVVPTICPGTVVPPLQVGQHGTHNPPGIAGPPLRAGPAAGGQFSTQVQRGHRY